MAEQNQQPVDTARRRSVLVEGIHLPPFLPDTAAWEERIQQLRQMKLLDDDVFLLTHLKAGSNWLWEIITMLRKGRAEHDVNRKLQFVMGAVHHDKLAEMPSPRTFCTSLPLSMLPVSEMKTRQLKLVHVYRNPKDSCVSLFNMFKEGGWFEAAPLDSFEEFSEFYFFSNKVEFGSYFKYLGQIHEFQQQNPEVPLFNLSFEDVKKDTAGCVKKLAQFLCLTVSDELCSQIAQACSLDNMKKQVAQRAIPDLGNGENRFFTESVKEQPHVAFRKGQVGDWKNYFNVAMNERVDDLIQKEMQDLPFTLTFE